MYPILLGSASSSDSGPFFFEGAYNGSFNTITVTSGVDLTTEGLVYSKTTNTTGNHYIFDTIRGINQGYYTNERDASANISDSLIEFNNGSYRFGVAPAINTQGNNYLTFAMKKSSNYLDILTYAGAGTTNRAVPHGLGDVPGAVLIKSINDGTRNWIFWHKDFGPNQYLLPNLTSTVQTDSTVIAQAPDASNFYISGNGAVNSSSNTYMAYVFAHNPAKGIFCGSFTGTGAAGNKQTIGFKPKMIIIKSTNTAAGWILLSSSLPASNANSFADFLTLNTTDQVQSVSAPLVSEDDGFSFTGISGGNNVSRQNIFIAIG